MSDSPLKWRAVNNDWPCQTFHWLTRGIGM